MQSSRSSAAFIYFSILKGPGRTAIKQKSHKHFFPAITANGDGGSGKRMQTQGSRPLVISSSETSYEDDDTKGFPTDPRDSSTPESGRAPFQAPRVVTRPTLAARPSSRESAMRLTVSLRSGLGTPSNQARLTPGLNPVEGHRTPT